MPNLAGKAWAFAVELDDAVRETSGFEELQAYNPMIDPQLPAMYVGWSHTWPPSKYPDGDFSEAGHSVVRRFGVRRREDLRGTSHSKELPLLRDVEERVHQLRGAGHAVFCSPQLFPLEGAARNHRVYVLRLPDEAKNDEGVQSRVQQHEPQDSMPCVYVGQTSQELEERRQQHLEGSRGNHFVARYGGELVPSLYEHLNPLTRLESLRQERNLSRRLRRVGYWVLSN